jgi:hypothetical protein
MNFTFGIITGGGNDNMLSHIISTIVSQNIENYEIIIVGNTNIKDNVIVIPFDETVKKAWITKKKNLIAQNAKYDNLVILHDYVEFSNDWYTGFLKYISEEGDFDIISNKIINYNGNRFRDWCLFPLFLNGDYKLPKHEKATEIINSGCLLPYDFKSDEKINKYIYYSGAYFIVKKHILLNYPLDERKSWGDGEDVEWCRSLSETFIFKFNKYSTVKFIKLKDEPFWQKELTIIL